MNEMELAGGHVRPKGHTKEAGPLLPVELPHASWVPRLVGFPNMVGCLGWLASQT